MGSTGRGMWEGVVVLVGEGHGNEERCREVNTSGKGMHVTVRGY